MTWYIDEILQGDCLALLPTLPEKTYHTCITSPPYFGLRDYGMDGQIGKDQTLEEYIESLVLRFREVRRVMRDDGTLWLNLGDTYVSAASDHKYNKGLGKHWQVGANTAAGIPSEGRAERNKSLMEVGLKTKDLIGVPWRVAFALQADGWYLRKDIIWHKPNPMPESVRDRPTTAHEYIFLLSKSEHYYYDQDSIREPHTAPQRKVGPNALRAKSYGPDRNRPERDLTEEGYHERGRNKRSVWEVAVKPFKGAHFATFPPDLIEPCILAGCPREGLVLDPFSGAGTTAMVARQLQRNFTGIELNPKYIEIAKERLPKSGQLDLMDVFGRHRKGDEGCKRWSKTRCSI